MTVFFSLLPPLDLAALIAFVVLWVSYTVHGDRMTRGGHTLQAATARLRQTWMRRMCDREGRVGDSSLLGNLMRSVSFFASASVLILGGLVALLGAGDRAYSIVQELPLLAQSGRETFETKVVLLSAVFVYAFFQITWSLRQFNYCCVLLGAAPPTDATDEEKDRYAGHAGRLNALAAHSFNRGLRAYYFALAMMSWFIHAGVFVAATMAVVAILYRREFRSKTRQALDRAVPT